MGLLDRVNWKLNLVLGGNERVPVDITPLYVEGVKLDAFFRFEGK